MSNGIVFNFLDVGMGDGTLVEMPLDNGDIALVLVDFGEDKSPSKVPYQDATKFLINRISKICASMNYTYPFIDHLFITHGDEDHYNKLGDLIDGVSGNETNLWCTLGDWDDNEKLTINRVTIGGNLMNNYKRKDIITKIQNRILDQYGKVVPNGITELPRDCHYNLNERPSWKYDGTNIFLLSSNKGISINDTSLVLMFEYKGYKVILPGDASSWVEDQIVKSYIADTYFLKSFGIKLGHHGSKGSTGEKWIDAVEPKAIFASGDKFWGHPYCEPINRVRKKGTLGKIFGNQFGTHWYVCSGSGASNDYCNISTDLDICTNLWYVVTNPDGETRLNDDGVELKEECGCYVGIQWQLEIDPGSNPVIRLYRTPAWPAPDQKLTPWP